MTIATARSAPRRRGTATVPTTNLHLRPQRQPAERRERRYTWNADNQPTSITSDGVTETYVYDAEGERVKRTRGNTTTVYLGGLVEEDVGGATRTHYVFHGQVIAQRSKAGTQETLLYLHSDHVGSISATTKADGTPGPKQEFTPWGDIRSGGISETSLNYTGQRRDGTGLLYYHARYYDSTDGC